MDGGTIAAVATLIAPLYIFVFKICYDLGRIKERLGMNDKQDS